LGFLPAPGLVLPGVLEVIEEAGRGERAWTLEACDLGSNPDVFFISNVCDLKQVT
jgi:hypothetical protein